MGATSSIRFVSVKVGKKQVVMSISKLYIHKSVADLEHVAEIQSKLRLTPVILSDERDLYNLISESATPINTAKEILFLTRNKGAFIKKCPGTRDYTCCGYQILNIGTFCTMDCSYCILQAYYHPPILCHYVNYQTMLDELKSLFSQKAINRIGTGEFTDSLIWEKWTDLSSILISEFSEQSTSVLELKTKTNAIKKLEKLNHGQKTIMAWSLNTTRMIQQEERATASLSSRLKAASICESSGYPLAFHFDPMVIYDGCEEEYREIVHRLFSYISPNNVVWISLGTFRFMPALKTIIQNRFPDSPIIYGEFISGLDGKMRYFKPLRINLYRKIVSWIREAAPEVMVYLCMEDDEVWEKAFGFLPSERGGLSRMLDESAIIHCGLDRL